MGKPKITFEGLIDQLEKIDPNDVYEYEGVTYIKEGERSNIAEQIACLLFISDSGNVNMLNVAMFNNKYREKGYHIYPGETDSFGWLTGCIQTPDERVLVFG